MKYISTSFSIFPFVTGNGSIGKNGTSNFTNASEWAGHVESRAWYAEVTGYTATTVHVHFGPLLAGGVRAVVTARVK